jgi:hypothetical protein
MAGEVHKPGGTVHEAVRKLTMIDEGYVQDKARLGLDLARTATLIPGRRY